MDTWSITEAGSQALMKKIRQQSNEEAVGHFSIGIMGIICLYSVYYWTGYLYWRFAPMNKIPFRVPAQAIRQIRKRFIVKVPGFNSTGHAFVFTLYLIISFGVLFSDVNWINLTGFAKRLGWMTVLNINLTIFLSLKNTPLVFITNQSYEKLNCLHQIAGYSCVASFLLHAIVYTISLSQTERLSVLVEKVQILGITSGLALLVILLTAILLRKHHYEAFYITHILMAFSVLILAGLHRPQLLRTKSSYILIFAGVIWALDRLLRLLKYFSYSFKNSATITPLPCQGTRVIFGNFPKSAVPGQHFYIWIPGIRALETHPFTCLSTNPGEFIITAHNGFTRSLHERALKEPGAILRASLDGPYGTVPDLTVFSKVVFIAGGSGASFTCSLAVDLVRKLEYSTKTHIDFTLVVKHEEMIEWTDSYINTLASSANVTLQVHVTCKDVASSLNTTRSNFSDPEKNLQTLYSSNDYSDKDEIRVNTPSSISPVYKKLPHIMTSGRPDIDATISQAVNTASKTERIAIVACGPCAMMSNVRKATSRNIHSEGPSLQLFSEQFSW